MRIGTAGRSKHALAVELAALLTFAALRNNDKVGLLLFSDSVDRYVRPKKGRMHSLRILRDMLVLEPRGGGTALGDALAFLNRVQRKRAIVMLFSDFMADGWEKQLAVTPRHHDTIAFVIEDPREEAIPPVGWIRLEDLETGEQFVLDAGDPEVRRKLAEAQADRRRRRDAVFTKTGLDTIPLKTGEDFVKPLMKFFEARARRFR